MTNLKAFFLMRIPSSYVVMFFRSLALLLLFILAYLIYQDFEKNLSLIGVFGILIAALLASFSVVLNIDTTIKIKNHEHSNIIRNTFFQLCLIKMRLITLENEKIREKITYLDLDRIFDSVEDIYKLLSGLKSHEIVSIAHNDMLGDVHLVYLELSTLHTHLKSFRKNLIYPEDSRLNEPVLTNPMLTMNFKIDKSIENLTKILTYLRDGYNKNFKQDGQGIEACADYSYGMTQNIVE